MNNIRSTFISMLAVIAFSTTAHADLPLTVEDLITDKGKIKLDLSVAYANSDRQGVSTGEPILIQTGPTSFVTVPTLVGESLTNSDLVVGILGLRYGLTAKAEIFTRASYLYSSNRTSNVSGTGSNSDNRFADAWAGVNYRFKGDDDTPALLGFAETALREKHRDSSSSFQSYLLGLTTYKAIDPVVFVLTAAYRLNQNRKDGDRDYEPGDMFFLSPSVAFAVNDRVTLTTGFQWTNRQADKIDSRTQGLRRTGTNLLLGVGYGISKGSTLNFTFQENASGSDGANLRLNWLHTF
uniref:Outer membrane insertion C-terminal signal n=1 Tax=Candidatus Kentrum sp. TUN TaxID=2126343 RepID=A0A450ZR88_9GAMM|nr:MAG: outer membrane insertion C-terminal signal [Candidatus Kentron sp. TUN]VFK56270.1 MAG: outer membrane insertion C-terminal signal [Candidatus Kentron sp. TUN]